MSNQNIKCKNCGQEISTKAIVCPNCGVKNKKPFYKRWWFITLAVILVIGIFSSMSNGDKQATKEQGNEQQTNQEIVYTDYSVAQLITDLQDNALNAKNKYGGQYVRVTGKLSVIDSSGKYISIDNGGFDFVNVQCYLKNDEQRAKIASMAKGDSITIKGKVKDIGEVMGYSIDIDEVE